MNDFNPCNGEELEYTLVQASLGSQLRFELRSLIGRYLLQREPPQTGVRDRLLNLGCGSTSFEGWVNADCFRFRLWRQASSFWAIDLRYGLKCRSDYWDGVYCEHAVEHLRPSHAYGLFEEVFRTLKPGSWFRIIVPDLGLYIRYYLGESVDERFQQWRLRGAALRSMAQGWGHASLWDRELLTESLRRVGFNPVRAVEFRKGEDARLLRDLPERRWESLYVEARKPK